MNVNVTESPSSNDTFQRENFGAFRCSKICYSNEYLDSEWLIRNGYTSLPLTSLEVGQLYILPFAAASVWDRITKNLVSIPSRCCFMVLGVSQDLPRLNVPFDSDEYLNIKILLVEESRVVDFVARTEHGQTVFMKVIE